MIIVITRSGKCAGISTVIGSIDTRILTGTAGAALREDLKQLSYGNTGVGTGIIQYSIEIMDEDGSRRTIMTAHDPTNQWSTPFKRILNEAGMANRI